MSSHLSNYNDSSDETTSEDHEPPFIANLMDRFIPEHLPTSEDFDYVVSKSSGGQLSEFLRAYNCQNSAHLQKLIRDSNYSILYAAAMSRRDSNIKFELLIRYGADIFEPNEVKRCDCKDESWVHCTTYECTYTASKNISMCNYKYNVRRGFCYRAMITLGVAMHRLGYSRDISELLMRALWDTRDLRIWFIPENPNDDSIEYSGESCGVHSVHSDGENSGTDGENDNGDSNNGEN